MTARAVAAPRTGEGARPRAPGPLDAARPRRPARVAETVLGLLLGVVVAVLWWARDRGFNLSDEGYYLLSYAYPDPATAGATQFHLLVAALTAPLDLGLVGYRVLRVVLLAASAAGLAAAYLAFCRARLPDLARALPSAGATVAVVVLAGLLGSAWLPLALSYNGLSAALLQVETALVLWILSRPRRSPPAPAAAAALATGFLLGAHAFVKWPTAVVVAGLLAVTLVVLGGRRGLGAAGLLAVGAALAWLLLARELLGSVVTIGGLVEGSRLNTILDDYRTGPALRGYVLRTWGSVVDLLTGGAAWRPVALVVLLGAPLAVARPAPRGRAGRVRAAAAAGAAAVAGTALLAETAVLLPRGSGYLTHGRQFEFLLALLLALPVVAALAALAARGRAAAGPATPADSAGPGGTTTPAGQTAAVAGALFLALPFAGALGTNNHPVLQAMTCAAGFALLALLVLAAVGRAAPAAPAPWAVALPVLAAVLTAQIVHHTVWDPYGLPTTLLAQTEPLTGRTPLAGVRVDPASHAALQELVEVVGTRTGFAPGEPVLAASTVPGLVHLLGGRPPGTPWVRFRPGISPRTCAELARARDDLARTELLLLTAEPDADGRRCLTALWPAYPERLEQVAAVALPSGPIRVLAVPPTVETDR